MQGADALGNGRKVKTAGTTASGTLNAPSTDAQGVVSDVLKTPVAAVEGVGGNNLYYVTNKITEGNTPQPRGDQSQHRGVEGAPTATNSIPQTPENSNMKLSQDTTLPGGTGAAEAGVTGDTQRGFSKNLVEFFGEARQK